MEEIDYFIGLSNKECIDYYKADLYSRMEITLYTYPNEMTQEDPIPWEHFNRCEGILYEYLYNTYAEAKFQRWQQQKNDKMGNSNNAAPQSDSNPVKIEETKEEKTQKYALEQSQRNKIVRAKIQELRPELNKLTQEYMKIVTLHFVDL